MRTFLASWMLALGCTAVLAESPIAGDWTQVDLRAIETVPHPTNGSACQRIWFEERTYHFEQDSERVGGVYKNIVDSFPFGAMSHDPQCKFKRPAENPVASQIRMWTLGLEPLAENNWSVVAEPGLGGGTELFPTEKFTTHLEHKGQLLLNGTSAPKLEFCTGPQDTNAAEALLSKLLREFHSGECESVLSSMTIGNSGPKAIVQICELQARAAALKGQYTGVQITQRRSFDRVPDAFGSNRESKSMRPQKGVWFSFVQVHTKEKIPGDAILFNEGETWKLALAMF